MQQHLERDIYSQQQQSSGSSTERHGGGLAKGRGSTPTPIKLCKLRKNVRKERRKSRRRNKREKGNSSRDGNRYIT